MLETDIIFCFAFCLCWVAQHININYSNIIELTDRGESFYTKWELN